MALRYGAVVYRNEQEQVAKNASDIEELKQFKEQQIDFNADMTDEYADLNDRLGEANERIDTVDDKVDNVLPSTEEASEGQVLTLDAEKNPVWAAPSGGIKLYRHNMYLGQGSSAVFLSTRATAITLEEVQAAISAHTAIDLGTTFVSNDGQCLVYNRYSSTSYVLRKVNFGNTYSSTDFDYSRIESDAVTPL